MVLQLGKELGTEHGTVNWGAEQRGVGTESLRGPVDQHEVDEGLEP